MKAKLEVERLKATCYRGFHIDPDGFNSALRWKEAIDTDEDAPTNGTDRLVLEVRPNMLEWDTLLNGVLRRYGVLQSIDVLLAVLRTVNHMAVVARFPQSKNLPALVSWAVGRADQFTLLLPDSRDYGRVIGGNEIAYGAGERSLEQRAFVPYSVGSSRSVNKHLVATCEHAWQFDGNALTVIGHHRLPKVR